MHAAAYVDGLLADRTPPGQPGATEDAIVRPSELYVDFVTSRFDVRAGMSRVVWGRLDEFQPTDVINPIDLTRFIFEGRGEARLPVALVRSRLFLSRSSTIEAVLVPAFRASRFDQLDEASSPFNLSRSQFRVVREEPGFGWRNVQGGIRLASTVRRLDWSLSAYRGFRTFPIAAFTGTISPGVRETFPRFTMIGADFETVRGPWGVRGEVAAFVEDELQERGPLTGLPGRTVETGAGVDRRAGDYRVSANVLWTWRGIDLGPIARALDLSETDVSVVLVADRSFARETRTLRVLTVYDPPGAIAFGRVIGAVSLRDDMWIEASAGIFGGSSVDILDRLTRRDFLYARLKVFF
jgi:hypothetical protein